MQSDDLQRAVEQVNESGERLIADRLDAIEAERVMQRALELEAESLDEPHLISTDQLDRIAKEIGVDPSFVQQALGEVRLQPADRSKLAQWIIPEPLMETATINGLSRDDVDAAIDRWMTQYEGLTKGAILADGAMWDIDRRWFAKLRSSTLGGANRVSRVAGSDVAHRVHSAAEGEHVVALTSQGRGPVMAAVGLTALGAIAGVVALINGLAGGATVTGLAAMALWMAASAGVAVVGARWWARGIRGALRRSLVGLVGSAKKQRSSWLATKARLRWPKRSKKSGQS